MKKIIFLAVLVMLVASMSTAQSVKIAYVNTEKILQELPEYVQVRKAIESMQMEYQKMVKDYQDAGEDFKKKEALLDLKAKTEKENALEDMRKQIIDYQTKSEGEIAKMREKKLAPIQERVMKIIERVAKDGKFNYVFDRTEASSNLLYADSKYDLTYKVIDRLKTGESTAPVSTKSNDTK